MKIETYEYIKEKMIVYEITPVPKPRMTQRDKWLKPPRPEVQAYRNFKDICMINKLKFNMRDSRIIFVLPMPKSWSRKKKIEHFYQPHEVTPDLSNLLKAIEDAVYPHNDSAISNYEGIDKIWGFVGQIWIGGKGNHEKNKD